MVLNAVRGALGFLTRLPVGRDESAWTAFRRHPVAFPLAGYVVGVLLGLPFLLPLPPATAALAFPAWVVLVTGVNHADGLADLGDAAVVHGDPDERRAALKDTTVGVGAVVALVLGFGGLALGAFALAELPPWRAAVLVLAAAVAAKLAVAVLVCLGEASHEGIGSSFTDRAGPRDLLWPAVVAVPVLAAGGWAPLGTPFDLPLVFARLGFGPPVGASALLAGVVVALAVRRWASRRLGGVSGDVLGATNELARVAALHLGVVAWTLW